MPSNYAQLQLHNYSPFTGKGGEKLLQFIWQFQYFNSAHLQTTSGENVTVVHPGKLNKDQGPDFKDAKIKIGNTLLAGSVELHIKTTDWFRHKHQNDPNYSNVILHVVFENDCPHEDLPVLELQPHISNFLLTRYNALMNASDFIPCQHSIGGVKELTWLSWKERLLVERLTRKSAYVLKLLQQSNQHWEETFWWMIARSFGVKVNTDAFEAIARSISVNVLAKHKSQIHQLEALLFGQASLLQSEFNEDYPKLLQREYRFLQKKYDLKPVHASLLFLRMRPGNFPTIRLAQMAALVQSSSHLFSKILETDNLKDVKKLFDVTANDYWHYHYSFDQGSSFKKKKLGEEMINNLLINTVVPVLFSYGIYHKEEKYKEKALQWLQQLPSESNSVLQSFQNLNVSSSSAFDSQALLELKNEYCGNKRCLECSIGNALLKSSAE